jgi:hypothetical protein
MIEISVFNNTKYSKRVTLPAQIIKALGNPKKLYLTLEGDKIVLETKKED